MNSIPIYSNDRWLIDFISKVNPAFTTSQLENTSRMCQGLLSDTIHKSVSSIAGLLIESRDQSTINRFLTESDWGCDVVSMDINRISVMQQNRQTAFKSGGYMIIDDSLLEKSGISMDLVSKHFNHTSHGMKNGLSLVTVHYADDKKNYNLTKDVYLRKTYLEKHGESDQFRTKIEISIDSIDILVETFPEIVGKNLKVLFDAWFLSKTIVAKVKMYGLKYVSRAKSNRVISGLGMSLKEYASTVLKANDFKEVIIERRNKLKSAFVYTAILPISNLGDVKISFVKNEVDGPVKAYIVSNDLKLSGSELVRIYKERWAIETDYKDSKQYFGLADFHLRKKEGIMRYLTLCYLVSTYLEYCRLMGIFGHCFGVEFDLSTKGNQVRAYQHLMFERFLIWTEHQYSQGKTLDDLIDRFRGEECVRCRDNIQFVKNSVKLSLKMGCV